MQINKSDRNDAAGIALKTANGDGVGEEAAE